MSDFVSKHLSDLTSIERLYSLLTRRERRAIYISLVLRFFLVALDIVGLALIGVSVSLVSGTNIDMNSLTGKFIGFLQGNGLGNSYAIFGFASVIFFVLKGVVSIRLNLRVLNYVAEVEAAKSSSLYERIMSGSLDSLRGLNDRELFIGLVDSFDMSVSKLIMSVSVVFGELALMLGISVYLAFVNPLLLFIVVSYLALLGISMQRLVGKRTRDTALSMQMASVLAGDAIHSLTENFRQLRSLGKGAFLKERFTSSRLELAKGTATMSSLSVMPRYITEIALMLGFALLILQRAVLGPNGISAATIAIFVAGSFRLIASLLPFQGAIALLRQIAGSSRLAIELSERYEDIPSFDRTQVTSIPDGGFEIEFDNVSYAYPGARRPVISGVSASFSEGQYIALTGRSGSGKSTMADLMLGLRIPTTGRVLINKIQADQYIKTNPGVVAYVPQKCSLVRGTLRQNIALGDGSDEEVYEALKLAGLADWASELDNGLDSEIGDGARGLSGGQLQRIGLARALFAKPKALILDESTSALDGETESLVLGTLNKLRGNLTIIAIAHRGSVIEQAQLELRLTASGLTAIESKEHGSEEEIRPE